MPVESSASAAGRRAARPRAARDRLGRPMHDLRISVMDRCNFRCPYCMPRETFHERYRFLRTAERLDFEEILRVARLVARPRRAQAAHHRRRAAAAHRACADLVAELSVARRRRGPRAHHQRRAARPARGRAQGRADCNRVTVSLDSLDPEVFAQMSGGFGGLEQVLDGIEAALAAGLRPGQDERGRAARRQRPHACSPCSSASAARGVIVRLIEYMDVGTRNALARRARSCRRPSCSPRIRERWPVTAVRRAACAARSPSATRYDDGAGEIGFISSVSAPFCGDCTRARLSSEGSLYTCLFAAHGHRPARAAARRRQRRGTARAACAAPGRSASDRYSEIRDAELRRGSIRCARSR